MRIEATARESGGRLSVKGPGKKRASYDFPDMIGLLEHQMKLEAELVASGYTLEQFTAERRRWPR